MLRYNTAGTQNIIRSCRFTHSLVQFNNANVHRFGVKEPALKNLTLNINNDQRVVIVGSVGAGRSTLAEVKQKFCIIIFLYTVRYQKKKK